MDRKNQNQKERNIKTAIPKSSSTTINSNKILSLILASSIIILVIQRRYINSEYKV
jgi:hypothetical protein